ncbi:MAG: amylosucrase [Anaerolineaceae bacterium]|nr:MAG: amylosucrase [Anaerolineaceae bacterium]
MNDWAQQAAELTITRLLPRLEPLLKDDAHREGFMRRLHMHLPRALWHLHRIYGDQFDFFYHLEQLLHTAASYHGERREALKQLDAQREADPLWFKREDAIGAVCYVDLFAGDLRRLHDKIDYFKSLKIRYLHLMPLFMTPEGNSDGGYAISDFRQVHPDLGTMDDLRELTDALRAENISVVLDFVFNHTSDEHIWARKALEGDPHYKRFFYMFPDRTIPDQYELNLREIFPEQAPGCFTYRAEVDQWVWTTFNNFQWDLNYGNPDVFNAMLGEMLFLANQGVEVLRLDAVAFIWKQMGTPCENLPQVHDIIRGLNAMVRIAAPAMLFKSEAIVHPDDVASYIDWDEAPISYNPTMMALLWEALATRQVGLLRHSMTKRYELPPDSAWVNYVRVHDDIGWSFADEDAAELGINGFDHRQFLNQFYTGRFDGSFASGLPFNYNPINRDMRISGMCASLAGLERAEESGDAEQIDHAIKRVILLYSVIIAAGGIPLIYLGDEIAMLNDYSYRDDPVKADDSRWVHRPRFDWERAAGRHDTATAQGRVFTAIRDLIDARRAHPAFSDHSTLFFDTQNESVLGFVRNHRAMILCNFSEQPQKLRRDVLAAYWNIPTATRDLLTGEAFKIPNLFTLAPYDFLWLAD